MSEEGAAAGAARDGVIIRTSMLSVAANAMLAAVKVAVGVVTNSIAVTMDAINNMSDAMSSVVTIVGTKLSGREPDKKHPLGYGRIEYLTALVVAAIILYAGLTALLESVDRVLHPEEVEYSAVTLAIIGAVVAVKLFLGRHVRSVGRRVRSGPLVASGTEALLDAAVSASVFASAVIFTATGIGLEAYVGVGISLVIIRTALVTFWETVDEILGKRPDRELTGAIKATVRGHRGVTGAYDLVLHSYGPDRLVGSVHIEVADTMPMRELDILQREIMRDVMEKHGVMLEGIGVYSRDVAGGPSAAILRQVEGIVGAREGVLEMHGFYADTEEKTILFDIVIDFDVEDRMALLEEIRGEVCAAFPGYRVSITPDLDI